MKKISVIFFSAVILFTLAAFAQTSAESISADAPGLIMMA